MTPSRLIGKSLGGALVTSAVAAAWLAPGAAFATTATETLSVTGTVESVIVDPEPGAHASDSGHAPDAERTSTADHPSDAAEEMAFVKVDGLLLPVPFGSLAGADSGQQATVQLRVRPGTSRATALRDAAQATPVSPSSTAGALGERSAAVVTAQLAGPVTANRDAARVQAVRTQAAAVGAHKLTVLPVFWTAKDSETQGSLTTLANQAKSYWAEQSGGGIAIDVDVRDWQQVSAPSGTCNYTAVFQAALAANGLTAPNTASEHVAVYFPRQTGCAWAGLGSVNGSMIWINGYPWEDVLTHEFGHNLGLGHANKAACTTAGTRVPLSGTCTVTQYEDVTDVMGFAMYGQRSGNLNAAFGDYLGLQNTVTPSTTQKTTIDLSAMSTHAGTTGIEIPTSAGPVFVDFRPVAGRDTRAPGWAGVQVRLRTATFPPATQLLDMQPGTGSAFSAANLPVNGVWQVPGTTQAVKVTSAGATTATVEVSVGTTTDSTPPSAAPAIVTTAAPTNRASQTITWTPAVDIESGISAYRVLVNGTVAATTGGGTLTADVPLTEGANAVTVVGVNGAGLVRNSAVKTFVRDSAAPSAVTGLKVSADGRTVSWTAPADTGSARSYAVRVDGTLATTVATTPAQVSIAAGQRTVSVTPSDAAGNAGAATTTTVWIDPAAPVAPVITSPDSTGWQNSRQVSVAWTAASAPGSGIDSYTVTVGGKPTVVSGSTTSATITVPADGVHTVSVVAKNRAGGLSKAATATVRVDTVAPAAPAAVKLAADQSKLTWATAAGAGSPVSWRVQVDGGAAILVTKPETPNATEDGRHTWTVTGVDAAGNTGPATAYTGWTDRTAPSQPVITAPSADSTTRTGPVTVTWTAAADDGSGITSYVVTVGAQRTTVAGTATSHTYRPTEGRQTITVAAVNGAGLSSPAASVGYTFDAAAPVAATGVKASGAGDATVLTWKAATDRTSGLAGYVLALDGVEVTTVPATATTATVTTPPGRHTWTVTAVDKAGNRSAAASSGAVWFDTTAPAAAQPASLPAVVGTRAVKVTWTPAGDADSGIKGYTVIATNGGRTVKAPAGPAATTATVTVPEDGTWQITVQAANQAGLTTDAPAGTVLVDAARLAAPVITSPAARGTTGTSFAVAWTAPAAGRSGISGYRVTVNGKLVATVGADARQAPVTVTAARATATTVTVTAVNGAGLAGTAATVSFTVKPA